jgi:NADPH-dependent 2,4-dienoyl-CoA reductase/sulfur reductase-like enzyme
MYELVVIGGGPAGMAAALQGYKEGLRSILLVERDRELGGILNQCIHNGFGLQHFQEELTGPEYAERFIEMLDKTSIEVQLNAMVLEIRPERKVCFVNTEGYREVQARALILAMGCRERTRGAIGIPGTRPAGVFTAGTAQYLMNIEGYYIGKRALILGSGDIGLIMARRLTLEGAKVLACIEVMPYASGLNRNIVQCLDDYGIPLYLSHTITRIKGNKRVEGAVVARVDEHRQPLPGSELEFDCDTILLSVGLIPENELSKQANTVLDNLTNGVSVFESMETSIPGIFACGNVVHVHDIVDFVTAEGQRAGAAAADFVLRKNGIRKDHVLEVRAGEGIKYTVPQRIRVENTSEVVEIFFRVSSLYENWDIVVSAGTREIARLKRRFLRPAEMERLSLSRQQLRAAGDDQLTVSLKENKK